VVFHGVKLGNRPTNTMEKIKMRLLPPYSIASVKQTEFLPADDTGNTGFNLAETTGS